MGTGVSPKRIDTGNLSFPGFQSLIVILENSTVYKTLTSSSVFGMGTGVSPKRIATSSSYPVFETVKSAASFRFRFLRSCLFLPFLNN